MACSLSFSVWGAIFHVASQPWKSSRWGKKNNGVYWGGEKDSLAQVFQRNSSQAKQAQFLRHKIFPARPETWFSYSDCVLLPLRPPHGHVERMKGLRLAKMPPKFPAMLRWSFLAKHSDVCYQLLASPRISVKLILIDFPRFLCSWWQIPGASFPQFSLISHAFWILWLFITQQSYFFKVNQCFYS